MRCACPWCCQEAEPGCEALFSGEPTCREHGYKAMIETIKKIVDSLNKEKDDESVHPSEPRRD